MLLAGARLTQGPATLCYVEFSYRRTEINSSGCSHEINYDQAALARDLRRLWGKAWAGKSGPPANSPASQDIIEAQCETILRSHIEAQGGGRA